MGDMNAALAVHVSRRGPPPRPVIPTPRPPASEADLRASIRRIEKFQGRSQISAPPTGWLGGVCSSRDCDGSGDVTVNEIIALANIDLGTTQPSACPHGIPSGLSVDITLIIRDVNDASPTARSGECVRETTASMGSANGL